MTLASRGKFLGFPGIFSEFAEFWLIFSELLLEMKKKIQNSGTELELESREKGCWNEILPESAGNLPEMPT